MREHDYTIEQICTVVNGRIIGERDDRLLRYLVFDSRKIDSPEESLFFALRGSRDGHLFVPDAYRKGIRHFVVQRVPDGSFPAAVFVCVEHVLTALQSLAGFHRSLFRIPVVAITGSNGKTIVKDWLYQLLHGRYSIVRSPKSFNSQLGVPLSLWQMSTSDSLALIEAGISFPGEMERLQRMIKPTVGILTNIKQAHKENFPSSSALLSEKLKLFVDVDLLIYSPDYVPAGISSAFRCKTFTWGYDASCDLRLVNSHLAKGDGRKLTAEYEGQLVEIEIPFTDDASVENAIICWCFLIWMKVPMNDIQKGMRHLNLVKMRLELKNGLHNTSIIDDSYSCDVSSLSIALDFLKQQNQHATRTLILSDIPEIGSGKKAVYQQIAALLKAKSVDRFIGVGEDMHCFAYLFPPSSLFFPSTDAFLEHLKSAPFYNQTVLIKGARSFQFERISRAMSLKAHETVLEINLNALEHNLDLYKKQLSPGTKLMVMVKAFSYGSGSFEIANLLQFNQVDYLAVAYADEGIALRNAGIKLPIMVMSPDLQDMRTLVNYSLQPEIYSLEQLHDFVRLLSTSGLSDYPVHLKIDSGMHRLGFQASEFASLLSLLKSGNGIRVESVFSHFAASDEPGHDAFSRRQLSVLREFSEKLQSELGYSFLTHIANTAAISRIPESQLDMVRLGIGLYGIHNFPGSTIPLQPVATLKTLVSQVKTVAENETIGYGRQALLTRDAQIATVKIGYADGYDRRFGNGAGKMWINGRLVPTIGNICMDMCMLDVTGIEVSAGDDVIVFGTDPAIETLADNIGTIPYEIITGISERVKRIYFYE